MSVVDNPNTPIEGQSETTQTAQNALDLAKQDKLSLMAKIDHPKLKKLAEKELTELTTLEAKKAGDTAGILEAHREFETDIKALDTIEEKFGNLKHFPQFVNFLSSGELSSDEMESLYDALTSVRKARRLGSKLQELDLKTERFPLNRESYNLFANKFGIKTSTELQTEQNDNAIRDYLNALPALQSIEGVPEVEKFTSMLLELKNLEGTEAQNMMQEISTYLVGENGKGGEIDIILIALKKKDAQNIADGKPSKYFETFTRIVRDFSPDVAKRIDVFVSNYENEIVDDRKPSSSFHRAIIQGGLPAGTNIKTNGSHEFVSKLSDGLNVSVEVDGDHISRSISLGGVKVPTGIERADYSAVLGEYETIKQDLAPKQNRSEGALSFLENPQYSNTPLSEMKDGLRAILGYTLYIKLGIANMSDKQTLKNTLDTNISEYKSALSEAQKTYQKDLKSMIVTNRERYRENDEKIKTTLRAVKNSGLGLLDLNYLTNQLQAGYITSDIGVPFDKNNIDLANQNFGEMLGETKNPSKHIEYIYRFANKLITGNPDGMVDNKLIGFSLEQAKLNPDIAQKTDGEVKHLLKASGVWDETVGVNKGKMMAKLSKSIPPAYG